MNQDILARAQGCFLGQCSGDALGQLVEFRTKESILAQYPTGVRVMEDGGAFDTLAGQPTDDTELALMLARSLVKEGRFDGKKVFKSYLYWYDSGPFDCGNTIANALEGRLSQSSQANGALMRCSPLGIYGTWLEPDTLAETAMADCRLTHPHLVCQKASAIYVTTIAEAIRTGLCHETLYRNALMRAQEDLYYEPSVYETLQKAETSLPENYKKNSGWVLLALQNAFYHLLNTGDFEEAVIKTVSSGGDTDTNGAICGALLGAVHGLDAIPKQWRETVLNCKATSENPRCENPRPECFWAVDALELTEKLLACAKNAKKK